MTATPGRNPLLKSWWFWVGIIVLLAGFVLYVRTWTRAQHFDFTPATNPPPPVQPRSPASSFGRRSDVLAALHKAENALTNEPLLAQRMQFQEVAFAGPHGGRAPRSDSVI